MTTAEQLRDLGIARSSQSAERLNPEWNERAWRELLFFAQICRIPFSCEDVRDRGAWRQNLPEPPDRRAWGGIFRKAAKQGLIRKVGYTQHRDPKRHAGISTLWETVR